jgi:6-phosphogluconolactonase
MARRGILHKHANKAELSTAVGRFVADAAQAAVAAPGGRFAVALSGGSLPGLLAGGLLEAYADLSDAERSAHFAKWHVFFADERCVPNDHPDSNFRGCAEAFLSRVPVPAAQVHRIDDALVGDPAAAAAAYEAAMAAALGQDGALDMALLGMGPDGHTCSLFPGHALLKEASRRVAAISDSPKPPARRITLTFPAIRAAAAVVFVAAGASKADVFPAAFAGRADVPAGCAHARDGSAHWFVDDAAAAQLP